MARTVVRGKSKGDDAPRRSLDELAAAIRKEYGGTTIMLAKEKRQPLRLPTGIFTLDLACCGGIPFQTISMFYGPRSSGKTTGMLKTIASVQRMIPEKMPALVDAEHTFDPVWAEKLGVDLDRLLVVQPASGEEAVDICDALMRDSNVSLVCLDSIAALVPMKEIEESAEDAHVGIHAKLVTRLVRKVNTAIAAASKRGEAVAFLVANQQRSAIGKWAPAGQEALSLPGGKALEFFTALQVKFKNKENLKKDDDGFEMLTVNEHAFTIDKNKFNAGIRKGEFLLQRVADEEYGLAEGDIDDAATMLAFGKRMGIYTGAGRSWTLELPDFEDTMGSADEWISYLYENRDVKQQLRNHLIAMHAAKLGMPQYVLDATYAQVT